MPSVFASHWKPGTPGYLGHLVPAGTVPYALQSLPGDIWLKIVDHTGRHNGLRRTCRKLMTIIPAVYRAKVTGSEDLGCFTEFLRSRVGHLYGVDVIAHDMTHSPWPTHKNDTSQDIYSTPEWDKFCAASSAFVAVLAQCPDLHVLRMLIPIAEPAIVAQLHVRTLDFIWPRCLSPKSRKQVVKDFLSTMNNSCTIHTLNIDIVIDADIDDLCFMGEPSSSCSSLSLEILLGFEEGEEEQWHTKMIEAMAVLKGNPALCSLTITTDGYGYGYGDALAMAVSQLRYSGSIHTLHLDFDETGITAVGAVCLSQLRNSPALCALTLSLRGAYLDNLAMESLSTLRDTPGLKKLSLTLEAYNITNEEVCNIAKILQSHSLHEFTMRIPLKRPQYDAEYENGDDDTDELDDTALCEILHCAEACGTLRHLSLDFRHLKIGYAGVDALVHMINQRQVAVQVCLFDWHCKDWEDDDGLTPLMHAVQKNALDCVDFLSRKHTTAQNMKDPVVFAITHDRTACMALLLKNEGTKRLLKTGELVHIAIKKRRIPSIINHVATWIRDPRMLALLLENKAAPDEPDGCGIRPLWYVARDGNSACTTLLLDSGAHVDGMRKYGCTPLSIAAANGHVDCVELLLRRKANVNMFNEHIPRWVTDDACDDNVGHPIDLSSSYHLSTYQRIIDDITHTYTRVTTVSQHVQGRRNFFLNLGFETGWDHGHGYLTGTYDTSCGPLWRAARRGHVDCVRLLLESNAHIDARDTPNKRTALWISVWRGHTFCVKLLLEMKANVHLRDHFGISPICIATKSDYYSRAISQLFSVGAP